MDFDLTPEQQALQKAAREFAEGEFDLEYALECDRQRRYPREVQQKAARVGLVGVQFPVEYGGGGYGLLEEVLVIEALCRKDPGLGVAVGLSTLGCQFIAGLGTEEQKRSILPRVASGEMITAVAFTEPDHGSDITDLTTTALRDGDRFVVNGVKTFITNGLEAQVAVLLCKTDPSARPGYRGLSLILVGTDRPGFEAADLGAKMGQKMLPTAEIALKNVVVPASNLVGQENRGFYHSMDFFNQSRIDIAAQAIGAAQAAYDRAVNHVRNRRQAGKRLADFQATQHKVADMATKIEMARLMTYRAAWSHDHLGPNPTLASMAKLAAARVAVEVAEETIQLYGGYGYLEDNEVERIYRDVRVMEIYEGTREIQKNTIAAQLLGI